MAMFLKLEASSVENTKIQSTPGIPDFMDWNQITSLPLFWKPFHSLTFTIARHHPGARPVRPDHRHRDVQAPRRRHLLRDHHPGGRRDPDHPDRRTAGLHRRHQRHDRPAHAEGLGHPDGPRQDHPVLRRGGAAVRLHRHRAVHPPDQARPHPGGDARTGRPRPLLRLQRRQLQDLRLLHGGGVRRDRRRDVRAQGRFHVAVLRRHRAVDRDGDLHRGRRTDVDLRRGVGLAAGQLRQDQPLGILPAALAVRPRRAVHRGRAGLPERPGRHLGTITCSRASTGCWRRANRNRHRTAGADNSVADGAPAE